MKKLTISRRKLRAAYPPPSSGLRGGFRNPAQWEILVGGRPVAHWEAGERWRWLPTPLGEELGLADGWRIHQLAFHRCRPCHNPAWSDLREVLRELLPQERDLGKDQEKH